MLNHFHKRIAEKNASMKAAPVLIVALGDSVTHGYMALNELDQLGVFHHQLWRMLIAKKPACVFSVINAGVGGDSAPGGLERLQRDVVRHQPDLVTIGYALNDACGGGDEGVPKFTQAIADLVTRTRGETSSDVILLTPNFLNTRDSTLVAEPHRKGGLVEKFMAVQKSGTLGRYAGAIRDVGQKLGVPVADVYSEWEKLEQAGVDTTAMLTNGLNHPNPDGHRIVAESIMRIINETAPA